MRPSPRARAHGVSAVYTSDRVPPLGMALGVHPFTAHSLERRSGVDRDQAQQERSPPGHRLNEPTQVAR